MLEREKERKGEREWRRRQWMTSNGIMTMMTIDLAQHLSSFLRVSFPSIGGHRLLLSLCTRLYKRTHGTLSLTHTHVLLRTRYTSIYANALTYTHDTHTRIHTRADIRPDTNPRAKLFRSNVPGRQAFASSRSRVTSGETDVHHPRNEASTFAIGSGTRDAIPKHFGAVSVYLLF